MATTSQEDPSDKSTLYNTCKEKVKTFVEEWSNNFKMCYCPCKINKYGMMDSDDTDNETPVPLTRGDDEEDTHKMEVSKTSYTVTIISYNHCTFTTDIIILSSIQLHKVLSVPYITPSKNTGLYQWGTDKNHLI